MRQASGKDSRVGNTLTTASWSVYGKVELEQAAPHMRMRGLRPRPARLRARARGVGAEMAPRGRASGQRAEVGVRAEVAG